MNFYAEALQTFADWYAQAQTCGLKEPTAMTLATATAEGRPSARTVLLKSFDERGLVFFTNYESRKGRQLLSNPFAALTFHWMPLERQVHVEGRVENVSDDEADAYWKTRARDSQLGAWASQQSRPLAGRFDLEKQVAEYALRFGIHPIPRPAYWSGFRVVPERIEFWKARPFRLHHRVLYEHTPTGWIKTPLFP